MKKIAGSGTHLLGLINEVLDVSKIESGTMELQDAEFNLCDLVDDAVELVRLAFENKRQNLSVHMGLDLQPDVRGDERRLKQVLVNVLENASKYTEEEGKISLSIEGVQNGESPVGTYRFIIEDNGIGMNPEFLARIFDPFSRADDSRTSKIAGTGLGMTIVKNLVTLMGGDIQVESEKGKGSRFVITLVLHSCQASEENLPVPERSAEESFTGLQVLLVEDNELNCQIAKEMLELLSVRVDLARDGLQAVQAVRSHSPFYYDLVFMDVQMPVLNGYEATKKIRNSGIPGVETLPILAMTADAFDEDVKLARLSGMNGHLAKPISIEQLKNVLLDCLSKKNRNSD